ncbi:unnamed protein product [Caenorhabditis auriculariae]|uniref:Uncharacterized protein n=1 Tax=Caenorhabditis auriculariae TaxID=2777116 RepID=A0A8S1HEU4_9PELO|nr:unnamed protein product [Caenorhabditis auriculariae]
MHSFWKYTLAVLLLAIFADVKAEDDTQLQDLRMYIDCAKSCLPGHLNDLKICFSTCAMKRLFKLARKNPQNAKRPQRPRKGRKGGKKPGVPKKPPVGGPKGAAPAPEEDYKDDYKDEDLPAGGEEAYDEPQE